MRRPAPLGCLQHPQLNPPEFASDFGGVSKKNMPSRVLRDGLWESESVNALHDKTFRFFVCLLNAADDFGLCEVTYGAIRRAAPLQAWSREDLAKMLGELVDHGLIVPYEQQGKRYCCIAKWQSRIQSLRPKYPVPSFGMQHVMNPLGYKDDRVKASASLFLKHLASESTYPENPQVSPPRGPETEGVRDKGEGKEITTFVDSSDLFHGAVQQTNPRKAHRLPPSWQPPDDWLTWAHSFSKDQGKTLCNQDLLLIADSFRDHWCSKPGKDGLKLDWQATWRNWIRNHVSRLRPASPASSPPQDFRDT